MKIKLQNSFFDVFEKEKHILEKLGNNLSTPESGNIPYPYIPRIGKEYEKGKVLFYGKAQNKPFEAWVKNEGKFDSTQWIDHLNIGDYSKVWIQPYYVMLCLVAIYQFLKTKVKIYDFSRLDALVATTNYYKWSLVTDNGTDWNPDKLPKKEIYLKYIALNRQLVRIEVDILDPEIIFTFNGNQFECSPPGLSAKNRIYINDPSWITRGSGYGALKEDGSWWKVVEMEKDNDKSLFEFVDTISDNIPQTDKYGNPSIIKNVKTYLKYYAIKLKSKFPQ